ncbi:hypothetical protein ABH313_10450, partial [Chromobacterium vaccinii]|uniref:hypothetical protein n=1 Tax=Chromobacterium vaccinii TaxID=1108595 RepID=UPI0032619FC3
HLQRHRVGVGDEEPAQRQAGNPAGDGGGHALGQPDRRLDFRPGAALVLILTSAKNSHFNSAK